MRSCWRTKTAGARPVFILGHWRSGTTFVHNVSLATSISAITNVSDRISASDDVGTAFLQENMSWLMPDKRPTDNMELAVDLPQEEEFAVGEHDALYLL